MNVNGFRKWLKAQIACFDDDTDVACDRADETVPIIREAGRIAVELGLPDVARHCATVTTSMLALPVAQLVLCECMAMLPKPIPDGTTLTVTEAARLLKVNRDKVLGWINAGRLRAANVSKGFRPRWRISQRDLDTFLAGQSTQQTTRRKRQPAGEYTRFYPEH